MGYELVTIEGKTVDDSDGYRWQSVAEYMDELTRFGGKWRQAAECCKIAARFRAEMDSLVDDPFNSNAKAYCKKQMNLYLGMAEEWLQGMDIDDEEV